MPFDALRVRIAAAGLCLALACLVGCAEEESEPSRPLANPGPPTGAPTDRECRDYGEAMEAAARSGSITWFNEMIDWEGILERAIALPNQASAAREKFLGTAGRSLIGQHSLAAQILNALKNDGDFKFLRVVTEGGTRVARFRFVAGNAEGLNYYDFILTRRADGRVWAGDVYVYGLGERISESLRRTCLPAMVEESKTVETELTPEERRMLPHLEELKKMIAHVLGRRPREAMQVYNALPPSPQEQKVFLLFRLKAAMDLGDDEYDRAIVAFREAYPNDACVDLISIDSFFMRKQYDQARNAIDRVDKSLGGDPYLNVIRANTCVEEKKFARAREYARKAVQAEETLVIAYWTLVEISLEEKDFDETSRVLTLLGDKFAMVFNDLTAAPEYAEFVKSPQYKTWLEKTKRK